MPIYNNIPRYNPIPPKVSSSSHSSRDHVTHARTSLQQHPQPAHDDRHPAEDGPGALRPLAHVPERDGAAGLRAGGGGLGSGLAGFLGGDGVDVREADVL